MASADHAVARRYAEAFVNTLGDGARLEAGPSASSEERLRAGLAELEGVAQVYSGSKDLQRFLGSPEIGPEDKQRVLARVWAESVGKQTMALLDLLIRWDRMEHLPAILEEAKAAAEKRQGVLRGEVITARPISGAEAEALAHAVGRAMGGKRVILKRRVEPQLLGGVQVAVGSSLLDASVRGFLKEVRQQLKAVKVN